MSKDEEEDSSPWSPSKLNDRGCLSLYQIMKSFSAPLKEEHAWALAYQFVDALRALHFPADDGTFVLPTDCKHIYIHKDGGIHTATFSNILGLKREAMTSKNKCLLELGSILFSALDFGLKDEEERSFSNELEALFDIIDSVENQEGNPCNISCDDEGIQRDEDDEEEDRAFNKISLKILTSCASHLAVGSEANDHYRAVCRALVSEALEISEFLDKIVREETETQEELRSLGLRDWAGLWCAIMRDLRMGVKLKKTDFTKTPIEYELTPYEILMDDIRSKNYKLNKVPPPRTSSLSLTAKRDAHEIILEFIRSRPPLKPASRRKLPPCRKESTPAELLMESIRNTDVRKSLRKTNGPRERSSLSFSYDADYSECDRRKKVLQLDESLKSELLNFDDEVDTKNNGMNTPGNRKSMVETSSLNFASIVKNNPCRRTQSFCEEGSNRRTRPRRKLFIEAFSQMESSSSTATTPETESLPGSPTFDSGSFDYEDTVEYRINTPQMHASLQSEFLNSEQWETALQTLNLSLEEVIHIRSVLTKAEMEGLPLDGTFKEDVEKGKICFLCMRARFGIFTWSHKCQLCHQHVCNKCCTKMSIPMEHFESSITKDKSSSSEELKDLAKYNCLSSSISRAKDVKKSSKLTVCTDCREMVLQVIRTQKTARRVEMSKSFYLSLTPKCLEKEELY